MEREPRDFQATVVAAKEVHELPGSWPTDRLQALLADLEVDAVGDDEAMEMATMALQDLKVDDASDRVLRAVFGDRMRSGVRQNLVPELQEDRPWEEFADITQQAGIFEAVTLLQRAFPREFGKPDATALDLRLETGSPSAGEWLDAPSPDPGLLLRVLAAGMDDHAVLRRLFEASLASDRFPEAASILWHVGRVETVLPARGFRVVSSQQWLAGLSEGQSFPARAWPDVRLV